MVLNITLMERLASEYKKAMEDKTLLRHERRALLHQIMDHLVDSLRGGQHFESELSSLLTLIDGASDADELRRHHELALSGIKNYFLEEQTAMDVHDLLAMVRDRIIIRVIALVEQAMGKDGFPRVTFPCCWCRLNWGGRKEEIFSSLNRTMLVCGALKEQESEPQEITEYYVEFVRRLEVTLEQAGIEGTILIGTVEEWKGRISAFLDSASGDGDFDATELVDARPVQGESGLLETLLHHLYSELERNSRALDRLVNRAASMPIALNSFGKLKIETSHEQRGKLNVQNLALMPLAVSVRTLSLARKVREKETIKRVKELSTMGVMTGEMARNINEAFLTLTGLCIQNEISTGDMKQPCFINLHTLSNNNLRLLQKAMKTIKTFQKSLRRMAGF